MRTNEQEKLGWLNYFSTSQLINLRAKYSNKKLVYNNKKENFFIKIILFATEKKKSKFISRFILNYLSEFSLN